MNELSTLDVKSIKRTCHNCGDTKPLDEFDGNKSKPLGKSYQCKACRVIYQKMYRGKKGEQMKLTEQKLAQILSGMMVAERKVYNLIPLNSFWTSAQIFAESKRKGMNIPITSIKGTAIELVNMGVVKISGTDMFSRIPAAQDEVKPKTVEDGKEFDLTKTITKQISTLRSMSDSLQNQVNKASEMAGNLELAMVYMLELEEAVANKEFQAFLAFKAAIKG